jgi:tryptophan 2,3-dioxygenase
MSEQHDKAVTYTNYLKVDELLELQVPLSDGPEHDELLFITIHQVYELWFKQLLHESQALQVALESSSTHRALSLLGRMRTIMKTCVAQLDILETMTPLQFNSLSTLILAVTRCPRKSWEEMFRFHTKQTKPSKRSFYWRIEMIQSQT